MTRSRMDSSIERHAGGRPPIIDTPRIAAAALAEIDGLSLAAVARRLGVAKSAIYHHVGGRRDLLELAAVGALGSWRRPGNSLDWPDFLHEYAASFRDCLMAHPGLDEALLELHDAPPAMQQEMAWAAGALVDRGIVAPTAQTVVALITHLALHDARQVRARGEHDRDPGALGRAVDLLSDGVRHRLDQNPAGALLAREAH